MRDIAVGRDFVVQGDFTDNSSSQPKLLVACTNEELLFERVQRRRLLQNERSTKWSRLAFLWLFIIVALGLTALWFYIRGLGELSGLILGFGGLMSALASLRFIEEPTEFEARQLGALQEIKMLLRERGVTR